MNERLPPGAEKPAGDRKPVIAATAAVLLLIGYLLLNVSFDSLAKGASAKWPPSPVAMLTMVIAMGILGSEIALACVALVWGQGRFIGRLLAVWFVGLIGLGAWGVNLMDRPPETIGFQTARAAFAAMPSIVLAIQAPLWPLRLYLGWRVVHRSSATASEAPLSIRDILIGTAISAVSLSLLRLAVFPGQSLDAEFWLTCGVAGLCLAASGLFAIAPLVFLALYFRGMLMAALASATYAVMAGLGAILILVAFAPDLLNAPEVLFAVLLFVSGPLALLAPLFLARLAGYRLVTGKSSSAAKEGKPT
jgi:hypothetical protein